MTPVARGHPSTPAAAGAARGRRVHVGRVGRAGADAPRSDPRRPVVLRCPGPLVALRALAALYGVAPARLATCLSACEARADSDDGRRDARLRTLVSDAFGRRPRTPAAVHYFHAVRLVDPASVLEHGLPGVGPHTREHRAADAPARGPRGWLVRDVLLRPALYGTADHLIVPDTAEALGFDPAQRLRAATTPCIVEYRRNAARYDLDIDTAMWFVAAGLRGAITTRAIGGHGARSTPIAAGDIVSVRAIGTQTEWAPRDESRR